MKRARNALRAFIETREFSKGKYVVTRDAHECRLILNGQMIARYRFAPGHVGKIEGTLAGNHSNATRATLNALMIALHLNREIITRDGVNFIRSTIEPATPVELSPFEWFRF